MAKKRKQSAWVPEILWRLFGNRARTLADTIVSLLPPSPSSTQCRCKGRRCLGCSGGDAMSFLLRPNEDPYDYRHLLKNCFVVVSPNAPPLEAFQPDLRWPQIQIVRRTIEMLLCEQPVSTNLLCSGYDKCNRSSSILELLTSSTWAFLLKRVGDGLMVYLLKYTSIFLPHPHTKYQQVAGPPITNLCYRFSKRMAESEYRHPSPFQLGSRKKRKTTVGVSSFSERENVCSSLGFVDMPNSSADNDGQRILELQQNSNEKIVKPKKRGRPSSWQRRGKRMQLNFQETKISNPCTSVEKDNESSIGRRQRGLEPCSLQCHNKMPYQCFCCSVLKASQKVKEGVQINRQTILYKVDCCSSVLPRNHVLNFLKPSFTGANLLFREIFGLSDVNRSPQRMSCSHSSGSCLAGSACLYHSLVKTLKILIRRAQSCQYSRLLDKHCAVPSLEQNLNPHKCSILEDNESGNLLELNKSYCTKSQVVSYIWAVCRSIVPPDLLGTTSNWRILRRNISKFIRLRRFEKFSLKQCMHKLKASRFSLFSNSHSLSYLSNQNATECSVDILKRKNILDKASYIIEHRLLESWIFWFFSCLVVPLVQANFYVTESEHGKQDLFYYRKSDWKKLTERVITSLEDRSYLYLDDASVRNILSNRSFGFSKLRLCPKEDKVRLLANLKSSSRMPSRKPLLQYKDCRMRRKSEVHSKRVKSRYFKSVNSLLRDLHAVLKGLQMKEPDQLGASVFNYNDVYRALCPFILGLKNGSTAMPSVYIVVSDVVKAFDSVDQDKLLGVMKNLILQDDYILKKSHQVICTNKSLRVHENLILTDHMIGGNSTTSKSPVIFCSAHSVLVNQECSKNIRRSDLSSDLIEHVKHNVLQLDGKFYLQVVGIPQGSVLSTLLCSFYYGHLERNVIYPFLDKACEPVSENSSGTCLCHDASSTKSRAESMFSMSPKYVLLRFVDDFLFLSTSKSQAANFFTRLQRGFREYNCFMNKEKSCLNFEGDQISGFQSNRVYVGEDGISYIRWSGLLINCCSLEVQADYTRYLNIHLRSTLTVCWQDEPGRRLKEKLCGFMRPKCHPIFYDSNINSAAVVRLNIYQSFLLCAMKFHCYVSDLSYICKFRTKDYVARIERSFRYMHALIKKRMHPMYLGSGFCPLLQLEAGEVEWLGLNAYIRVLQKKQSRHKELLSFMRSKLLVHKVAQNVSSQLEYAVDECHSSLLWKIKY